MVNARTGLRGNNRGGYTVWCTDSLTPKIIAYRKPIFWLWWRLLVSETSRFRPADHVRTRPAMSTARYDDIKYSFAESMRAKKVADLVASGYSKRLYCTSTY